MIYHHDGKDDICAIEAVAEAFLCENLAVYVGLSSPGCRAVLDCKG